MCFFAARTRLPPLPRVMHGGVNVWLPIGSCPSIGAPAHRTKIAAPRAGMDFCARQGPQLQLPGLHSTPGRQARCIRWHVLPTYDSNGQPKTGLLKRYM